jgi:hypothetical protein
MMPPPSQPVPPVRTQRSQTSGVAWIVFVVLLAITIGLVALGSVLGPTDTSNGYGVVALMLSIFPCGGAIVAFIVAVALTLSSASSGKSV